MLDYTKKVLQESRSEHATRVPFFRGKKQTFCSICLEKKRQKIRKILENFTKHFYCCQRWRVCAFYEVPSQQEQNLFSSIFGLMDVISYTDISPTDILSTVLLGNELTIL
jgi:hypothetical protein